MNKMAKQTENREKEKKCVFLLVTTFVPIFPIHIFAIIIFSQEE